MDLIYAKRELDDQKIMIWNSLQSETLKDLDKDIRLRILLILRDEIQHNILYQKYVHLKPTRKC